MSDNGKPCASMQYLLWLENPIAYRLPSDQDWAEENRNLRTQLAGLEQELATATRKLEEITTLSCRWKASLISGDDLADKVFDVFSGRTGEDGK